MVACRAAGADQACRTERGQTSATRGGLHDHDISETARFTLIEALTAAGHCLRHARHRALQTTLSYNSDVAKQRTEAVRLAQLKIEELRAYEQTAGDGAGNKFDYTDDVVTGADTVTRPAAPNVTNTSYARAWTVTATARSAEWIRVS